MNKFSRRVNTWRQTRIKVKFGHKHGMGLALALTEAEDDDRLVMLLHDHFDNFKHMRRIVFGPFGSRAIFCVREKIC